MAGPSRVADDLVTVDEFNRLVPEGQKADLIDVDWLLAKTLPPASRCLQAILGKPRP
jgi:hypothetical protein